MLAAKFDNDKKVFATVYGTKSWWFKRRYHRENGPAVERSDGYKSWRLNGKYHREDGPAIEKSDGRRFWCLDGIRYTEYEYYAELSRRGIK